MPWYREPRLVRFVFALIKYYLKAFQLFIYSSYYGFWFLTLLGKIKTNVNRRPTFRFVNAIEYMTVSYFNEIKTQRIKEHSNEVGGSNLLVYLAVTCKLRHVTTTKQELVNPYQKPQQLMMRLIKMFSNEGD